MTYTYTRSKPKTRSPKYMFAALAIIAALTAFMVMTGPKAKPTPLATQPMVIEIPVAEAKAGFKWPEVLTLRWVDNTIRDVQIDNAHIGHKMKMAFISEDSVIRRSFSSLNRKFSFMAILVGFAFLFTLVSFGFIKGGRGDLSNY